LSLRPCMFSVASEKSSANPTGNWGLTTDYLVSLCAVCLRQRLQNFENSRRPVVVFLFFVVE
jgi:hypothetical protein